MKFLNAFALSALLALPVTVLGATEAEAPAQDMKAKVQNVQSEVNDLVDQGGKYVYMQLARSGKVSPFAVGRQADGAVIMLEVPKSEEKASFEQKILKLRQMLKLGADSNKFVAGALFVQAQVPHQGKEVDGVAIEMEHKLGISVLRFSPYEVDRDNQKIRFEKPVDKIKPVVFFKGSKIDAAEKAGETTASTK